MKNLRKLLNSLITVNIILLLAVGALFVLYLTNTVDVGEESSKNVKNDTANVLKGTKDSVIAERIAVVQLDTLLAEYKLAQKLNEDLMEDQKKAEAQLQQKMSQFEKDYKSFEEKMRLGSFISEASMKAQQKELQKQNQELQQLNSNLSRQLAKQQEQLTQSLYDTVINVMPRINKGRFVLILGDAVGTNVLYSNDAMDITKEVIAFLNERYERKHDTVE